MNRSDNSIAFNAQTTTEKLYDLCMIEQLCRGNQEKVKKMVDIFIQQVPLAVEEIKTAYHKKDFAVIRSVAHRIKPTLSYYAVIKIEKDVRLIEALADEGLTTPELELRIEKLHDVVTQIVEKMRTDLL